MIIPALQTEIEKAIGQKIKSIAPLSAANNAQIYRLLTESGAVAVAKVAEHGLDTEAFMLRYLKENSALPVPRVLYSNAHVIIMEYMPASGVVDHGAQRNAAEVLAALHSVTQDTYGFERETVISGIKQVNTPTKDWVGFFAQNRLLPVAKGAVDEKKVDPKFVKQVEKLITRLPNILQPCQPPGLIHGDVWSGNILCVPGKISAFLDPAIYYADPEIELAYIRLFNTFNDSFFARYAEIRPIRKGFFEERADIYALYPLLVHTRMFGASYGRKAQKILDRFS
jgi:fructosamine-3-kinase